MYTTFIPHVSCRRIRLGYQQALNVFNIFVFAFVTSDALQSQILCSKAESRIRKLSANIVALNKLLDDVRWELYYGKKHKEVCCQVEQLERLKEALTYVLGTKVCFSFVYMQGISPAQIFLSLCASVLPIRLFR